MPRYMTQEEQKEHFERNKERNIRFIRAKLPKATPKELSMIASFIRGMGVDGWSESEYNRNI